jgi:DNA-binding CsgD family transcriptional regulator/tetratricopeptide (TPR) repeat protein
MLSPAKLVGRGAEIAVLDGEYRRAAAGEFRAMLVLAEAGVGKTRLAREFLGRKRNQIIALPARGYPLGATVSFGVWVEALEHHLRGLRHEEVGQLCGGFLDDLATVLRSVAAARGPSAGQVPSRPRLLSGLAILLSNLAKRAPVIVLIDDAHDADPSSWEALGYLARDLSAARVLVLVAARPFELGENAVANGVSLRLEQDGALQRLELQALDPKTLGDLTEAVLNDTPPAALVNWLAARSRGNPLFALGLLQALLDDHADLSAPELRSIPEELAERVGGQLKNLDVPAIGALELLAAIGRRTELRDLTGLVGLPFDRLAEILERLVRSRLVVEDARGRDVSYEIAHPLVQEAIYQRISTARRRVVHRVVARVLLAAGRLGEAAPHFARSADIGDAEAIEALRDAVCQAEARHAFREALTILDALFELLPPSDERWLEVLEGLSWRAEWVVDHRADAHALLGIKAMKAIDRILQESPDPAPRAVVKIRLANFLGWGSGDLEEAEHACREAWSLFERAGDRASALLARNELGWIRGLRGDYPGMEDACEVVAAAAKAAGEQFATIQALQSVGFAASFRGRFLAAEDALRQSITIARHEGKVYRVTIGLVNLGVAVAAEGRTKEAIELFEEGKAINPEWRDSLLPEWESIVKWFAGDMRGALASARDATARAAGELSKRRALGVVFAALAAAEAGESTQAHAYLTRARGAYGSRDWQFFSHYCGYAQGFLEWQEGRLRDACANLRETAARVLGTGALPYAALALVDLAEVAAERDDTDLAGEAARQLEAVASQIDCDLYRALAEIGSACAGRVSRTGDRGAGAACRAIDRLTGSGWQGFRARALEQLGRSSMGHDVRRAVETLRRAAAGFDAIGAVWRRDRTRALLRSMGPRGRTAAAAGLGAAALSRRERQVARLAVQGLITPDIAERLTISERTVETHLANIYTKLGLRSKIDLIRRASEFSLNQ